MDLDKIKKQWDDYNEEFDNSDFMDIDTHTSMAMQVGVLIDEVERLTQIIKSNSLPLHPCDDCGKEEKNPGLPVCGPCYHKRITGEH